MPGSVIRWWQYVIGCISKTGDLCTGSAHPSNLRTMLVRKQVFEQKCEKVYAVRHVETEAHGEPELEGLSGMR